MMELTKHWNLQKRHHYPKGSCQPDNRQIANQNELRGTAMLTLNPVVCNESDDEEAFVAASS
jgi:hypothetical protein